MTRSFGQNIATQIGLTWEPEIFRFEIGKNDKWILIGTAGLWKVMTNEICVAIISQFYE